MSACDQRSAPAEKLGLRTTAGRAGLLPPIHRRKPGCGNRCVGCIASYRFLGYSGAVIMGRLSEAPECLGRNGGRSAAS